MFKQIKTFRENLERTIAKKSINELKGYYRNGQIALVTFAVILNITVFIFAVYQNEIGLYFTIACIFLIFVIYHFHLTTFIAAIPLILAEELDSKRMIAAIGMLRPDTMVLPTLNYANAYLMAGDWEKANAYLGRIKPKRMENPIVKGYGILYWTTLYLSNILQKKDVDMNQYAIQLDCLKLTKDVDKKLAARQKSFIQAIADIESGKPNDYFKTANTKHKLDRLIFDYYLGKNALLEGNQEEAQAYFEKVAQLNKDEIYFVREAKNYLEEI